MFIQKLFKNIKLLIHNGVSSNLCPDIDVVPYFIIKRLKGYRSKSVVPFYKWQVT